MARMVKREVRQDAQERRTIRSDYLAIKNRISDEKDEIMKADSHKFNSIINEVETLHQLVQKPREQVADAEALLDIASSLVTSVRSLTNGGVTPSDFVTALLSNFGHGRRNVHNVPGKINWADLGFAVSRAFKQAAGCCNMIGPMKSEIKQRRASVRRRRARPTESARPEELPATEEKGTSYTDKNMVTMFEILRKRRRVKLDALVLNRASFAQTVENVFALSFLVKDGRVEITLDDAGNHLVSPRNAPTAKEVASGKVLYHHFVFRFDYQDWKLMAASVGVGEELMPHRPSIGASTAAAAAAAADHSQQAASEQMHEDPQRLTTPVRKLSRNRGLVVQEHDVGRGSSPEEKERVNASVTGTQSPKRLNLKLIFSFEGGKRKLTLR